MKPIILILALTTASHADVTRTDERRGRGQSTDTHTRSDETWTDHTRVVAVPEPSPPLAMLVAAGLALIGRRHRPRRIRERRVDMRTVRYL